MSQENPTEYLDDAMEEIMALRALFSLMGEGFDGSEDPERRNLCTVLFSWDAALRRVQLSLDSFWDAHKGKFASNGEVG